MPISYGHGGRREGAGRKRGPSPRTLARHALALKLTGSRRGAALSGRELYRRAALACLANGDVAAMTEFAGLALRVHAVSRKPIVPRAPRLPKRPT